MIATTKQLRSYACRLRGFERETIIPHYSAGKAKTQFVQRIDWDVDFTDVLVRVVGDLRDSEEFRRNATYRGIEFAYVGMRVIGEGVHGRIVGHNGSANLNVLCDKTGIVFNVHPTYNVQYFADDGSLVAHIYHGKLIAGSQFTQPKEPTP